MASKEGREFQKSISEIISQLSIIIKTSLIHDTSNVAVKIAIEKFLYVLNALIESEKGIILELLGEFFYLNNTRVRYSIEYLLNYDFLVKEFRKREIGSLVVNKVLKHEDVEVFLRAFIASGVSEDPYETLLDQMTESHAIKIDKLKKIIDDKLQQEGDSEEAESRKVVKKTYFNAVTYTRGVMNKIKAGEKEMLLIK